MQKCTGGVDGERVGRCRGDKPAEAFTVMQMREDTAWTRKVSEEMMGTGSDFHMNRLREMGEREG